MPIFNKPVNKKQLIEITEIPESTFYRRLKELKNKPNHRHNYSPQEAEDVLLEMGYKLEGEVLRRALKATHQKLPE